MILAVDVAQDTAKLSVEALPCSDFQMMKTAFSVELMWNIVMRGIDFDKI